MITELLSLATAHVPLRSVVVLADPLQNACPKAPPGLGTTLNDFLGYAKFVVLWGTVVAFFASLGALTVGRLIDNRGAARWGTIGLTISVIAAALFAVGYVIITSITGSGC
jgi:hypothetical protein